MFDKFSMFVAYFLPIMIFQTIISFFNKCWGKSRKYRVECQKYGGCFSKTRSQNVASKKPYFQKAPLIEKWTQSSFPLITLFPVNPEGLDEVNKVIRVDEKEAALLLRGLLQNKGSMQKKNEYIFTPIAHFVQPTLNPFRVNLCNYLR